MAAAMSGHQRKRAGQSNGDSRNEVRAASPVATATAATVFWESGPMMSPLLAQSTDGLRQVLNKRFANTRTHTLVWAGVLVSTVGHACRNTHVVDVYGNTLKQTDTW